MNKLFLSLLLFFVIILFPPFVYAEDYEIIIPSGSNQENCNDNLCFNPISITIKQGDTVTWINGDDKLGTDGGASAHQLSSISGQDFPLQTMKFGETKSIQFHELGKTEYQCILHPWMVGEIIVEERSQAYEIKDDSTGGDCNKIGSWNEISRTCKLERDIDAALIIKSNYLKIDGDGHIIDGNFDLRTGFSECILADSKIGLTIKNFEITSCHLGINFKDTQQKPILDNTIYGNAGGGINMAKSNENIVKNNEIFDNDNGGIFSDGDDNIIENNKILNNSYMKNKKDIRGVGISLSFNSPEDNIIRENTIEGHNIGINLATIESENIIEKNIISKNVVGIKFGSSEKLLIISNKIDNNLHGIQSTANLFKSNYDNTIKGNDISNNGEGVYLISNGNIVTENSFISNESGLILHYLSNNKSTKNNQIFNNNFIENDKQVTGGSGNSFNVNGFGNYWSDFSPYCDDDNSDKICDEQYPFSSGNVGVLDSTVWKEENQWRNLESFQNESEQIELPQKIPEWVKNIFGWYSQDQVSEDELLNAIKYLITEKILIVD